MFGKRCYDMPKQNNFNQGRDVYQDIDIEQNYNEINNINNTSTCNPSMNIPMGGMSCGNQPIIEQPIVRCVHRTFNHEVPHVCPIKTKIINHHIYRHTYRPSYSCEEQNDVSQINEGSCCNLR